MLERACSSADPLMPTSFVVLSYLQFKFLECSGPEHYCDPVICSTVQSPVMFYLCCSACVMISLLIARFPTGPTYAFL